jgi:hypothetical protein
VLLVHPTAVVEKLKRYGLVDAAWLDTYKDRQIETKELTFNARKKAKMVPKLVTMKPTRPSVPKASVS